MTDDARTVLITGGSRGLGLHTAKAIARADRRWVIVLAGHDRQRVASATTEVAGETGARVVALELNLASLDSIRRFAAGWPGHDLPSLRGLVCNAGVQAVQAVTRTEDGFETTFAVNHLGHFLLTNLLLGQLTAPARIVFVASDTHDPARRTGMPAPHYRDARTLADPAAAEPGAAAGRRRYTTSKLCNVLTAYEFARRLGGSGITVNAFDPGLMPGSGLARDYRGPQRFAWHYLLPALTVLPLNINRPARSGAALARLAVHPGFDGVTGKYFQGTRQTRSSADSYDRDKATELWRGSAELVGRPDFAD